MYCCSDQWNRIIMLNLAIASTIVTTPNITSHVKPTTFDAWHRTTSPMPAFSELSEQDQIDHIARNAYDARPYHSKVMTCDTLPAILASIIANKGGTFKAVVHANTDTVYATPIDFNTGYMVSLSGFEKSLYKNHTINLSDLTRYVCNVQKFLDNDCFVGAWLDSDKNQWILDISIHVESSFLTAINLAKTHNQKAIWDCENGKEIITNS